MTITRLTVRKSRHLQANTSSILKSTLRPLSSFSSPQNDQQLQWSVLRTDHFQKSLPRLPIPKLTDTCNRYIESTRALFNDSKSIANTESIVARFQSGVGKELNEKLIREDKANKHTSYISAPWFDMYLRSRTPLVLNYNPFLGWKDDARLTYNEQSIRTLNLLVSSLRFYRSLKDKRLEPEVFHLKPPKSDTQTWRNVMRATPKSIAWYVSALAFEAYALDMSQFERLFASTRLPRLECDELVTYSEAKHVVLLRHGQFYRLQVLDDQGQIHQPVLLLSAIRQLLQKPPPNKPSICAESAEERNRWANDRSLLESIGNNRESFKEIDSGLMMICLDDTPTGKNQDDLLTLGQSALHGNIQTDAVKPSNRWFDKSLSVVVSPKGHAAVTFEHSWGDGVAVLRYFNDVFEDSTNRPALTPADIESAEQPETVLTSSALLKEIPIQMNPQSIANAEAAQKSWFNRTAELQLKYILFGDLSREQFKKAKLSPDSMFQLAFQLAFQRTFQHRVATYEACSTSAFRHGRTETVRPVTQQTVQACDAILQSKASKSIDKGKLKALLSACSDKHSLLTKQAAMGQGFDRHLFALRIQWEKENPGKPLPDLYLDPLFQQSNHFVLSTSTLYGEAFSGGGFGPVVKDGFGVAYGYVDGQLGVLCSAYQGQRDPVAYVNGIEQSLKDIRDIIA